MVPTTDTAYVDFPAQAGKQVKLFCVGPEPVQHAKLFDYWNDSKGSLLKT